MTRISGMPSRSVAEQKPNTMALLRGIPCLQQAGSSRKSGGIQNDSIEINRQLDEIRKLLKETDEQCK